MHSFQEEVYNSPDLFEPALDAVSFPILCGQRQASEVYSMHSMHSMHSMSDILCKHLHFTCVSNLKQQNR